MRSIALGPHPVERIFRPSRGLQTEEFQVIPHQGENPKLESAEDAVRLKRFFEPLPGWELESANRLLAAGDGGTAVQPSPWPGDAVLLLLSAR